MRVMLVLEEMPAPLLVFRPPVTVTLGDDAADVYLVHGAALSAPPGACGHPQAPCYLPCPRGQELARRRHGGS